MFYATIFYLNDQVLIIHPSFETLNICLEFLKQFLTHADNTTIGFGCLAPETIHNIGIRPI